MVSKKQRIAMKKFAKKQKVTNKEVAEALGVGVAGTESYMKPLGFMEKWEKEEDVTGQKYEVKVWVQC